MLTTEYSTVETPGRLTFKQQTQESSKRNRVSKGKMHPGIASTVISCVLVKAAKERRGKRGVRRGVWW
jgi:hypothetical protein